jgi:Protein of unknown function (DUF2857)
MNHLAEYTLQTLLYVSRMAAQGELGAISRLGIRYDQAEKITAMSTQDIHEMALTVRSPFMQIAFDPDALDSAFTVLAMRIKQRSEIVQLLQAGASFPVMKHLYGLNTADVSTYRKVLNLPKANGRPTIPDESKQQEIWDSWKQNDNPQLSLTERLLNIHRETGVKINVLWALMQEWFEEPLNA